MDDALFYRTREQNKPLRPPSSRRVIGVGVIVFLVSMLAVLVPLMLPRGMGKYPAVVGFIGCCVGISIILHGVWDFMRSRKT